MPEHDACDLCGSDSWGEAHFAMGRLFCAGCWAAFKAIKRQARQLALDLGQGARREAQLDLLPRIPGAPDV